MENLAADNHLILALTVKAMNDTLDPNDVVPLTIVFCEHLPVFTRSENYNKRSTRDDRVRIALEPSKKIEHQMAEVIIDRALHHAVPPAANVTFERNNALPI